jgi:hypothetical protein
VRFAVAIGLVNYVVSLIIDTDQSTLSLFDKNKRSKNCQWWGQFMLATMKELRAEQAWQRGFFSLKQFKAREGHCRVPRHHREGSYRLGQWAAVQRYCKDNIAAVRSASLNEIGFMWSRPDWLWEKGFASLKAFKAHEGHRLVPAKHIEGRHKLGYWVSTQRRKRNIMSKERKQRLKMIGFVWQLRKPEKLTSQLHRNTDHSVHTATLGL